MPATTAAPAGRARRFKWIEAVSRNRLASCAPLFGSARLGVSSALSKGVENSTAEAVAACHNGVRPPDHDATIPRP